MKNIIISELEYNQLLSAISQLTDQLTKLKTSKAVKKQKTQSVAHRLYGILRMPKDFDEKQILQDEILKKYLSNG